MHLAICWSGSSNLHLLRQKPNYLSHIVTQFMDVLFGVIHTRTLSENLLSVIDTFKRHIKLSQIHRESPRVRHLR